MGRVGGGRVHSAQFGDEAIVDVICLFRDFSVGLEDVSRRIISWRLPETVNSSGMDMFAVVDGGAL
jgi:hypothetical protein